MTDGKTALQSLDGLSTTMLIPLWAKALESRKEKPLIYDEEALRMLDRIDYDFSAFAAVRASQIGCCGRALLIDGLVRDFIDKHPDALAVHIAAGLDARYERLGRPSLAAWYDLDLPPVIEFRQRLLPESGNHYLSQSMFEAAWMMRLREEAQGRPVLLIAEGVLMYFTAGQLRSWFADINAALPQAELVFDVLPRFLVGKQKHHDALSRMGDTPPALQWGIRCPQDLAEMGLDLISHTGLSSVCRRYYPWPLRLMFLSSLGRRYLDVQVIHARFKADRAQQRAGG